MQGGKNWILPKQINANRFFWDSHWLESLVKPLLSLYRTEWRERGYGLWHTASFPIWHVFFSPLGMLTYYRTGMSFSVHMTCSLQHALSPTWMPSCPLLPLISPKLNANPLKCLSCLETVELCWGLEGARPSSGPSTKFQLPSSPTIRYSHREGRYKQYMEEILCSSPARFVCLGMVGWLSCQRACSLRKPTALRSGHHL